MTLNTMKCDDEGVPCLIQMIKVNWSNFRVTLCNGVTVDIHPDLISTPLLRTLPRELKAECEVLALEDYIICNFHLFTSLVDQ